jgi:SAM-dependent methyltransferase
MVLRSVKAGAGIVRAVATAPRDVVRSGVGPLLSRITAAGPPSPRLALDRYSVLAGTYDQRTLAGEPYRRLMVDRLAATPGEVILDVGCGTGLNFPLLAEAIGEHGQLIGVDLSAEMLERARARVAGHGWGNVLLVRAAAEEFDLPAVADAALICAAHDVMRSPRALANVLGHLRSGGRIVAAGPKWAPWWQPGSVALNLSTWVMNRDFVTTFDGFDRPWSHLAHLVGDLEVEEVYFGGGYIARGRRAQATAR